GLPPAPQVALEASLREIAEAITRGGLGCALVTDPDTAANTVTGLITDGDLRR
ncbi:MAG TPA: KpsF/GutQ family sugar-phosphate isomerase, partial [Alphaproteobacteria bacterium]|nr:KpsF/GutQ family sugar-phosphate isomerase [Alphaproteobacteria bacterium]